MGAFTSASSALGFTGAWCTRYGRRPRCSRRRHCHRSRHNCNRHRHHLHLQRRHPNRRRTVVTGQIGNPLHDPRDERASNHGRRGLSATDLLRGLVSIVMTEQGIGRALDAQRPPRKLTTKAKTLPQAGVWCEATERELMGWKGSRSARGRVGTTGCERDHGEVAFHARYYLSGESGQG